MSCVQSNWKVGFIGMKFSIQLTRYLQSFIKFVSKVCFAFGKKDQFKRKLPLLMTDVLIFNKLDCQNCYLTFLTFKLYTHIKSLPKSQFWNCTIPRKLSPLLETKCPLWFPVFKLFAESLNRCKSCIRAVWLFFSENRKWIFYET